MRGISTQTHDRNGFFKRNGATLIMGITALIVVGTADLFAGLVLTSMEELLTEIVGMMILIYCIIGMRGNIFGTMGSRLGTSMHMGTFRMSFGKGSVLRNNMEASVCLTMLMSAIMGITTWFMARSFFHGSYSLCDFIFISSLGGLLTGIIVIFADIIIAKEGFKRDWDVDNIIAPLVAAVGDIITIPMIFLSTVVFRTISGYGMGENIIVMLALVFVFASILYLAKILCQKTEVSSDSRRIVISSIPTLLFCLIFEIAAGMLVQNKQDSLIGYAVLLVMLPAFLNEGNALSGILTSRLCSAFHMGTIRPDIVPARSARENFIILYVCAIVTFVYIGLIFFGATFVLKDGVTGLGLSTSMAIIMIAGMLATTAINLLSYYVATLAVKLGLDPDDQCLPIASSIMDTVGTFIMMMTITLFI